jgi:hypothetical protein
MSDQDNPWLRTIAATYSGWAGGRVARSSAAESGQSVGTPA